MANTFKLKRSSVQNKVPTTGDLQLGELALNTFDGKLYTLKNNGTASVVEIGAAAAGVASFSAGTTGLTPSTAATGAVTLAGTLAVANGGTGVTTSTGSGSNVLSTSPTLTSPLLGTPTSGTLTNCTGYTFANIASKPTSLSGYGITDAPTTTGTGASGTWGISVTGSSASCTGNSATTSGCTFPNDSSDKDNITTRTDSGFYQTSTGTIAEGWPTDSVGWHHLLSTTHSNDANYYAMQIAARFDTQNWYFRNTNGSGTTAWSAMLHSGNYTSYSPSLTGSGASGTWGISITGSAASATTATNQSGGTVSATTGSFSGDVTQTGTGAIRVANGTTAQRPTGADGHIRYNNTLGCLESFIQGAWQVIANTALDYGLITSAADTTFDYGALI